MKKNLKWIILRTVFIEKLKQAQRIDDNNVRILNSLLNTLNKLNMQRNRRVKFTSKAKIE